MQTVPTVSNFWQFLDVTGSPAGQTYRLEKGKAQYSNNIQAISIINHIQFFKSTWTESAQKIFLEKLYMSHSGKIPSADEDCMIERSTKAT